MVAGERAHVLDDAADPQEAAPGHVGGSCGHLLGGQRRCGDDEQIGAGQHAGEAHLHVAGARRHVDEQVVELTPVHVVQELLDGLGEHQPTPHQRGVLAHHEPGADHLEQPSPDRAFVGHDLRFVAALHGHRLEAVVDAQQPRHRETPDVGVEHPDGEPLRRHGCRQVHGDGALAHAALAAGDGEHTRGDRHLGVRGVLAGIPASLQHHIAAFLAGHLAPVDLHRGDPGVHGDAALDVFLDLCPQRAAADGELDAHGDQAVGGDRYVRHHAERHDVGAQFGVDHRAEQAEHLLLGGRTHGRLRAGRSRGGHGTIVRGGGVTLLVRAGCHRRCHWVRASSPVQPFLRGEPT